MSASGTSHRFVAARQFGSEWRRGGHSYSAEPNISPPHHLTVITPARGSTVASQQAMLLVAPGLIYYFVVAGVSRPHTFSPTSASELAAR
jgi:hypothetical protein